MWRQSTRRLSLLNFAFTYPAPRSLDGVVKLPLLRSEEPQRIRQIWEEYHRDKPGVVVSSLDQQQFALLSSRARKSPIFVFPLVRGTGYLMLLTQFPDQKNTNVCLVTSLQEYKISPNNSPPWATHTMYNELLQPDKNFNLPARDVGKWQMGKVWINYHLS